MATKAPPRTEEETRATARLRALGQGIRVYVLEPGYRYCVPSSAGDGSAYQVMVHGDTVTCNCPAGLNEKVCKHVAGVRMRLETEQALEQATSLAVDIRLHDQLERSLDEKVAELYS